MKSTENLDVFDHSDAVKAKAYRQAAETALIDPSFCEADRIKRSTHYAGIAETYEARMKADGVRA